MTFSRLLWRNLFYHWRGNLAVLLGVAVGTAVLVGALLVGDSLSGSLRALTIQRLGWVDQALVTGRFFREQLADDLVSQGGAEHVAPVLMLRATAHAGDSSGRAGRVNLFGVDERFWFQHAVPGGDVFDKGSKQDLVYLNDTLARALGANIGTKLTFSFEKRSAIPSETLLGKKDEAETVGRLELTVGGILPDDFFGSRFTLSPLPEAPRNAFVPLKALQAALGDGYQGKVDALLAGNVKGDLPATLASSLTLEDWNLTLRTPQQRAQSVARTGEKTISRSEWRRKLPESVVQAVRKEGEDAIPVADLAAYYRKQHPYISLESGQLLIEPVVVESARKAAGETDLRAAPTLVYLANTISDGKNEIPYSVVAALDPTQKPPLGPFLPKGVDKLADDEIVLVDWKDSPLMAKPGDRITLRYFPPEHQGKPAEKTATFRLAGFIPLAGPAADANLSPEFPGITDRLDIRDWKPPFPYDNTRVKSRDDRYWKTYRTTPKAYVTLKRGQELWGSRFGKVTSIRLAPTDNGDLEKAAERFRTALRKQLKPDQGGFIFNPVKAQGLAASSGTMDFGMLFLYFSFFLIVAALLLVGLLFRLNLDRRAGEFGLLVASGVRRSRIRWLLLGEGTLLAVAGAILGAVAGVAYAGFLLRFLRETWPGPSDLAFLDLYVGPVSLLAGALGSVLVSVLTIFWAVRVLGRATPRALLQGQTTDETQLGVATRSPRIRLIVCGVSLIGAVALVIAGAFVHEPEAQAGTFFSSGMLLLTAGLTGLSAWMRSSRHQTVSGHGAGAVGRLGVRNASRHPARSLLTAGLLASAAFLLVAVECFRRQAGADFFDRDAGSGGYPLLAESNLPVLVGPQTEDGRNRILDNLERYCQEKQLADKEARLAKARAVLDAAEIVPFRVRAGDDVSCLNLYKPTQPRLLGVPSRLIERGGFSFGGSQAETPEEKKNPWLLLKKEPAGGGVPVIGDLETVTWQLQKSLGDGVEVTDADGEKHTLRIVGLLSDSIFQSSLLLSEKNFKQLFPKDEGYTFFLIRPGKPEDSTPLKEILQIGLAKQGLEVTPTAERLASYLAVRNMYLSTFQALGGMGLLLGTLGLAVVLLRSVWERRGELALLRALGYRRGTLGWLVLAENAFLLLLGLGLGTVAALAAVSPHILVTGGSVAWLSLLAMLALALAVGLLASTAATAATTRAALIPALRRE
jgi:putative ABC transport system permease protein